MKSIFDRETFNDIQTRIQKLKMNSIPQWGKMDVAQMLAHCCGPFDSALGKVPNKPDRGPVIRFLLKIAFKNMLYSDTPYQKNLPTSPSLKVIDKKEFDAEKLRLLQNISDAYSKGIFSDWSAHPSFGYFTAEQWGKVHYKHLDHHLSQFGV